MQIRRASERGSADYGWLDTRHSFSFADYYDPTHMGFRSLRVLNDDRVAGSSGFPTHPHRDMEILSYVVEGALEHRDSMGNGSVIRPGEVQRMSAGSGIRHSEYNASQRDPVRFLQIWIVPDSRGGTPGYEQRDFGDARRGVLKLVASNDGRDGSVLVRQDVAIFASVLEPSQSVVHRPAPGRGVWVQVVKGALMIGEHRLSEGDGAAFDDEGAIEITAAESCEFLLLDLA